MSNAYLIDVGGKTIPMKRIHCKNEDEELQQILENNPDLLPGDQINPENPRRWLTIKREMGVPDPATGIDRWSIDFVVVDQSGIPTFVECKRLKDSRSRREVIGQMFDYAANGHYYWTKEQLEENALAAATATGRTLEDALKELSPELDDLKLDEDYSPSDFFQCVENNLREGQIRLVFFLEEGPLELRSIVDFLNKQMERTEVLLVEARQYEYEGTKIVVPTVFGYTEEARAVKRHVTFSSPSTRGLKWDETRFFDKMKSELSPDITQSITHFYQECIKAGYSISWGSGKNTGSFSIGKPKFSPKNFIVAYTGGSLGFNFGWLPVELAEKLKTSIEMNTDIILPSDFRKYPTLIPDQWTPHLDGILKTIADL